MVSTAYQADRQCTSCILKCFEYFDHTRFSGGTMERPALRRLLVDVEGGLIHCVVVYKVDRLSRSLLDFARLMSVFDKAGVSFVSVTQQFNTTVPLGRLTLNILLSFAQFERDIIGERTRDKLQASRRKGQWTGGHVPLGYDLDPVTHRLLVNQAEAERVRTIFALYREQGSLMRTVAELERRGWGSKEWTTRKGQHRPGRAFTWLRLRLLLTNVLYTGRMRHQKDLVTGQQMAIIDAAVFAAVNAMLKGEAAGSARRRETLSGLLFCDACGAAMTLGPPSGGSRRYMCGGSPENGGPHPECSRAWVSATRIEAAVVKGIQSLSVKRECPSRVAVGELHRFVERIVYNATTGRVALTLTAAEPGWAVPTVSADVCESR
jgi:site-specific DNA recombinase